MEIISQCGTFEQVEFVKLLLIWFAAVRWSTFGQCNTQIRPNCQVHDDYIESSVDVQWACWNIHGNMVPAVFHSRLKGREYEVLVEKCSH